MKTAIALLALVISAAPAAADPTPLRLIPPEEYDHPYTKGKLIVYVASSPEEVRILCPGAPFHSQIGALGCAHPRESFGCWVVLAPDAYITSRGFPPELVRRHEIAHCNGWGADHKGARVFEDWAEVPPELLCKIPFSPGPVCARR
jgi:hypothetical protein